LVGVCAASAGSLDLGGGVAVCIGGDTSGVVLNASILVRDTLVSGNKVGMESPLCVFLRTTL
jgi:hypothetical protein